MDTLKRRWLILRCIPRHGTTITAEEIRERLEEQLPEDDAPSLRTVQRDLVELVEEMNTIESQHDGRTKRYCWKQGYQFSLPGMDSHTALAFRMIEEKMARLLPRASLKYLKPFFDESARTMERNHGTTLVQWKDRVRVVSRNLEMEPPKYNSDVVDAIYESVLRNRQVSMRYRKRNSDRPKEYPRINPLGLVIVDSLIYLVATVDEYRNPVQFLVHRMTSVSISELPAIIPEDFTLQSYIDSGEFGYPTRSDMITLKAVFSKEAGAYLHETPLPGTMSLTPQDENFVLLTAQVRDNRQLRWWLRGFGDEVEIIEPESMRKDFRLLSKSLSDLYS